MRRFVVIGQKATASADFSLDDLPGSSGRLDVLLRCVRAALLVSHGVRRDAMIYLVLCGGPRAPRTVRIDGSACEYLRPDERSLAGSIKSMLAWAGDQDAFDAGTRGVSIARGGLDVVLGDLSRDLGRDLGADFGVHNAYVLDERAADVRDATLELASPIFFLGDHIGLADDARTALTARGAAALSLGPTSLHADDAITIMNNELDRRMMRR
jgi:tRNA (pseudouridine54-N1)-methyltransferase